jgi:hypothetical protein
VASLSTRVTNSGNMAAGESASTCGRPFIGAVLLVPALAPRTGGGPRDQRAAVCGCGKMDLVLIGTRSNCTESGSIDRMENLEAGPGTTGHGISMTTSENEWRQFCERASCIMRDALQGRITIREAADFFDSTSSISNANLRQYIVRAVCEIDGNRGYYMELLKLFESSASEEELVRHTGS